MALRGYLESASRERIVGWACETDRPEEPVGLVIAANDEVIARVLATRHRADLERASIGKGRCGFDVHVTGRLSPLVRYQLSVRREGDGAHLQRSPVLLDATWEFDRAMQASIARVLSVVADEADLERRLQFLAAQTDALLERRADRQGAAALCHAPLRALMIDETSPAAGRDAGSNAILSHMQSLRRLGFDVTFVSADLTRPPAELESGGVTWCAKPWYSSVEDVLRRHADGFDLVYLHRISTASRYAPLVRHHLPRAGVVCSVADLQSLRLVRQADVEQRAELRVQSRQAQTIESISGWYVDAVITHSHAEAELLRRRLSPAKVHCVPWHVPIRPAARPFGQRHGVAFIGNYRHQPNNDAARWLVDAVWPEVRRRDPTVICHLVGSDMPPGLRALATDTVNPVGAVADLAEIFETVRVTIAPLAFGAGIKGKVLDSLAAGIPCVCTPAAAEGLDLPPLLMAQTSTDPTELALHVLRLHGDEALNGACAQCGLDFVESFASEARVDALLGRAIKRNGHRSS